MNPILNCTFSTPGKYNRTQPDRTLGYAKVRKGRRLYDPRIKMPLPVMQGVQGSMINQQQANALKIQNKNGMMETGLYFLWSPQNAILKYFPFHGITH
ncbi:MAG: hypothetical protein MUE71_10205 [Chitinophagaceae bacterium]|nr:hypothetical protein [Chitinophagaceae bacterium]